MTKMELQKKFIRWYRRTFRGADPIWAVNLKAVAHIIIESNMEMYQKEEAIKILIETITIIIEKFREYQRYIIWQRSK